MSSGVHEVRISIQPSHLFMYPTEWDPRQVGKTKGGYMEGFIDLPKTFEKPMNLTLMTVSDCDVMENIDDELINSDIKRAHPTMLHLVRKNKNNRRINDRECIPSVQHWFIKFLTLKTTL